MDAQPQQPQEEPQPATRLVVVWSCDVCKVAKFQDFDEACRHEEQCQNYYNATAADDAVDAGSRKRSKDSASNDNDNDSKEAPSPPKKQKAAVPIASIFNMSKNKNKEKVLKDSKNNKSKTKTNGNNSNKGKKKQATTTKTITNNNNNNNNNNNKKQTSKSTAASTTKPTKPLASIFQSHKNSKSNNKNKKNIIHTEKKKKVADEDSVADGGTAEVKVNPNPNALMAEQLSSVERPRREESLAAASTSTGKTNHNNNHNNNHNSKASLQQPQQQQPPKKISKFATCPRFPVPSYIVPSSNDDDNDNDDNIMQDDINENATTTAVSVSQQQLCQAKIVLQKELPFPSQKPTLQFTNSAIDDDHHDNHDMDMNDSKWQWNYNLPSQQTTTLRPTRQDAEADFAKQFQKILQGTNRNRVGSDVASTLVSTIQDICGAHNQHVANDLVAFVTEWMVLRQGASERMAARQKALQKNNKRAAHHKKKTYYKKKKYHDDDDDDDEDLWFDSENEDEDALPPRICLIEGPVASCKSSLVHAVARQCDCQVVELNTSAKRSSADLKKVLEEATTSHSSLAMFKNRQAATAAAAAASLFGKGKQQKKQQELVDSDSDSNSDDEEMGNSSETKKKGCSLTIILIDEVDNIFETCGDAGFWSALNDLARKAQCPIFLTANTAPKQLDSMVYKYVATSRPTPGECAEKIKQVLVREGVLSSSDREEEGESEEVMMGLASLAELYECDLRRIFHRIQFLCSANVPISGDDHYQKDLSRPFSAMSSKEIPPVLGAITIEKVSPRTVSSETQTLLKIKGTNFDRLKHKTMTPSSTPQVNVFVGDQLCPAASIVDDNTILAVCPPLICNFDVDKFGMRNKTSYRRLESLDARFAPLSVQAVHPGGSLLVSTSNILRNTLLDETVLGCVTPYNVERCFPEEDDSSDVEFDERNFASRPSCLMKRQCPARVAEEEVKAADLLLRDELKFMKSTKVGEEGTAIVASVGVGYPDDSDQIALETLSDDLQLASDASLLDDYACIPFLSGASLGFGYQFTPDGSGSQCSSSSLKLHGNSNLCSEDRLFSLGWKDTAAFYGDTNAWVSQPMLARDRKLINAAAGSRLTHSASRKPSSSGAAETIEYDLTLWSPPSSGTFEDDDCYLPRPTPTPLLSLSSLLLDSQKYKDRVRTELHDDMLQRRKEVKLKGFLETSDLIFSREARARMHWKGMVDPPSVEEDCDPSLLLDYIPVLRGIAVLERAAHSIDDSGISDLSRRRTRKSAKRGRSHYFESLNFLIRWGEEGAPSAVAAGETFAKSLLTF